MLVSKFKILERPINFKVDRIEIMVKALCVLHNFIRVHNGIFSTPQDFQQENIEIFQFCAENVQMNRTRPSYSAIEIRERLPVFCYPKWIITMAKQLYSLKISSKTLVFFFNNYNYIKFCNTIML